MLQLFRACENKERGDGHSYWHWERESRGSCASCPSKSSNSGALRSSFSTILPPRLAPTQPGSNSWASPNT